MMNDEYGIYGFDKMAIVSISKKLSDERLNEYVYDLLEANKIYDDKSNYIINVEQTPSEKEEGQYIIKVRVRDKRTIIK